MMRVLFLSSLVFLASTVGEGAFERLPAGARAQALCGSSQLLGGDVFCVEANPASIRSCRGFSAGLSITPGLFGMQELRRIEAAMAGDLFSGSAGVLVRTFGYAAYREFTAVGAFGTDVNDQVSLGASVAWYSLGVRGYGRASCLGGSLGLSYRLADQLRYGLSLRNFNRPTLGRSREPVPAEVLTCLEFTPIPSFMLTGSLTKELDSPITGSIGAEWTIANVVILRSGAFEGMDQYAFGAGILLPRFSLDYAFVDHADLGPTHHLTLTFRVP